MAINVNEDGIVKSLSTEVHGWKIEGLDYLGQIIDQVPGLETNCITASDSNPITVPGWDNQITSYKWRIFDLPHNLGDYKYIIIIPESAANNNYGGYFDGDSTAEGQYYSIFFFNPREMWRVHDNLTTYANSIKFSFNAAYSYRWLISPAFYSGCYFNELDKNKLYVYNINGYSNHLFTLVGLRIMET